MRVDVSIIKSKYFDPFYIYFSRKGVIATAFEGNVEDMVKRFGLYAIATKANDFVQNQLIEKASIQIGDYLFGIRQTFDFPVDFSLITSDFQRKVLSEVMKIPYGMTITYGELAKRIGSSARAVGGANAKNPLPVIIPCHRVIGSDGGLRGYAGGIHIKKTLLQLEAGKLIQLIT